MRIGADRQIEFARGEVEHRDEVVGVAVAASLSFGGGEDAEQPFHEGIGGAARPVGEDAGQVAADHPRTVGHLPEQRWRNPLGGPFHPAAPLQQLLPGQNRVGQPVDVLERQTHLISFRREQIALPQRGQMFGLWVAQVFGVLQPQPPRLLQLPPLPLLALPQLWLKLKTNLKLFLSL